MNQNLKKGLVCSLPSDYTVKCAMDSQPWRLVRNVGKTQTLMLQKQKCTSSIDLLKERNTSSSTLKTFACPLINKNRSVNHTAHQPKLERRLSGFTTKWLLSKIAAMDSQSQCLVQNVEKTQTLMLQKTKVHVKRWPFERGNVIDCPSQQFY